MIRTLHFLFFFLVCSLCCFTIPGQAQTALNPSDPVVTYNSNNPPAAPVYEKITKWVRTVRMSYNTDAYKCYIYKNMAFRLKFPKTYVPGTNDGKKYPIYLFFHGVGEKGTIYDNEYQLLWGGQTFLNAVNAGTFDGYLIYPQSQGGYWGANDYDNLKELVDSIVTSAKGDPDRLSVNGLSGGGWGTWEFTMRYPQLTASFLPMSAAAISYMDSTALYKYTPLWLFQGGLDGNPAPYTTNQVVGAIQAVGGNVKLTTYPNDSHNTWQDAWKEPDFIPFMLRANRLNPYALFGSTVFCPGDTITVGIAPKYLQYEWQKDGVTIPGATSNSVKVTVPGAYRVRGQLSTGWTGWSPTPVTISYRPSTPAAVITTTPALVSNVLPAPDGTTSVTMNVPAGMEKYEWVKSGSNTILSTTNTLTASSAGSYIVRVKATNNCFSGYSDTFRIVNTNGINGPDAISNLAVSSTTKIQATISWTDNPTPAFNEKYFEIYRATQAGGPYILVGKNNTNVVTFTDNGLIPNTSYFYRVRPVNDNAAGPLSAEVKAVTVQDSSAPTPPGNLVASNVTNNTVTLTWTAATDDAAVAGYEIFANGAFYVAAGNVTTFNVTGLTDGNWYNFTVKAKDVAGKYSTPSNQVTVKMKKGNLTAKYYTGTWTSLPNFTTLTPAQTGTAFVPDLTQVPAGATGYAYMWTGYIKIPSTGTYTFETVSDDGSKLYFNKTYTNTATSTVSNDGVHASQSKTGTVLANAGVYPITITYFQNTTTAGSTMQVYWTNTLGGISRQLIPADAFVDPNAVTGNPPTAPSGLTASTVNFSKIKLNWTDNSNNETGFEIYRSATSNGTYSVVTTTAANIATYTDTLLQASTTYYYKIRAIGTYGESAYTSTANATTAAKPLPPATPANLVTTAVSTQIVKLTWTDNATNETGYEVHRSLADSLHFNVIASLPPITSGQGAWSDSSLTANTVAYYKVRAVGDGGYSTFTKATYAKSLNNPPVIDSIASRTIRYGTTVNVPVNATDPDNDPITLSLYNAPAFVTLQQNGTTTYLNIAPTVAQQGTYNGIGVIAKDNNNGADTSFFNLEVNDNYPPVINPVTDSTADEGVQKVLKLSLTDQNPGNTFTWTALQLPPFVTLQSNNDTCLLTVNAGYKDAGTYIVKVQAQDNQGGIDTKQFTLTVNDNPSPNYTLLLNFKLNTDAPAPWNNIGGSVTNNLKDTTGQQTNVGLRFEESWWAAGVEGPQTGNNSGVYPDVVLKEYLYFGSLPGFFNGAPVMHGHLSGLETNRTYTLKFHAGSNWWAPQPDNGSTAFTVNGVTKTLYVQNNTTNRAIFENVTPDANGEIVFTLSIPTGGQVGYLNALEVNAGGSGPVTPNRPPVIAAISNQTMDAGTTLNVPVSATDPDNDALTYTGLNLPSFATIVQNPGDIHIALAPATNNAGQYNNIGIIATDTHGNKDTATFNLTVNTPASTGSYRLLLRIRHQTDAPSPWNDITGRTNANLKNDQGQITGVGLNFDEYWWATNGEGATTGNNSGVYPDAVMHDHLYFGSLPGFFNGSPTMTGHITGLETSKTYTIKFFSSSKWWAPQPDNGSTKYTINGVSQTLYVQNNTSNVVTYNNITPASNGEIAFILSIPQGGQVGYINAIEIVANSVAPLNNNKVMTTGSLTNLSDKSAVSTDKSANSTGSSMQVNTYPNPFADALAVDITLQKTTNLLIEITDMSGRKVYTEVRRDAPQGRNTVRINTQSSISTTGMYILKVTAATGETQSKVIMKQR